MTDLLRDEGLRARDELDELYPGRARRRLKTLEEYRSCVQVPTREDEPRRWRTVGRMDREIAEWVEVTDERDPWVVKAAPGEEVVAVMPRRGRAA